MILFDQKKLNPYREFHPYPPFIPPDAEKLIIGSFPPIKLTRIIDPDADDPVIKIYNHYLARNPFKLGDFQFYYGSVENLFWKLMGDIYQTQLNSLKEVKELLIEKRIGVTDVIELCVRKLQDKKENKLVFPTDLTMLLSITDVFIKPDNVSVDKRELMRFGVSSGDNYLSPILFRDIPAILRDNRRIEHLIFSSINAFKLWKKAFPEMELKSDGNESYIKLNKSSYRISILPSPSRAANKSIGSIKVYQQKNDKDPSFNTYKYRLEAYKKVLVQKCNTKNSIDV